MVAWNLLIAALIRCSLVHAIVSRVLLNLKFDVPFWVSALAMELGVVTGNLRIFWCWNFVPVLSLSTIFRDIIMTSKIGSISIGSRRANVICVLGCGPLRMLTMRRWIGIMVSTLVIAGTIQSFLFNDHSTTNCICASILFLSDYC